MVGGSSFRAGVSRRSFIGAGVAGAAGLALAACSTGSSATSAADLKFWDMQWGIGDPYTKAAQAITTGYKPASGKLGVSYQSMSWTNWYQTFTSAAASKTTPAVSSGAAFLPYYFMEQGVAAPADDLVSLLDKTNQNDFLPGLLDAMKTKNGYVGVPWSLDLRVLWYRKSLLEKAGAAVPTDWDSFITAGTALKKAGMISLGMAANSTSTDAQHTVSALMINNGGGMFAVDGTPDCVTQNNIETLDFLAECVSKGIIDPRAASYTQDNLNSDWKSGAVAMGFSQTGLDKTLATADQSDAMVASPLKGRHGDTGTVYYINPLWMFKTTPSQASSEAFLAYYLGQIHQFWTLGVDTDLPVKKSITELPIIQNNPNLVKSVNEWQPIGKTIGAKDPTPFGALNVADGGTASATFVQQIVEAKQSSTQILTTLQAALEKAIKSA